MAFMIWMIFLHSVNAQPYLIENQSWQENLEPVQWSKMASGDFDKDGLTDLILLGCNGGSGSLCTSRVTKIYTNNGTSLVENQAWQENLENLTRGSISLGDVDNNGYLDLVLMGCTVAGGGIDPCTDRITKVYTNNGTSFVENQTWEGNLLDLDWGSASLGDIDNDGDLDLIIMGQGVSRTPHTKVYTNNGTSFVENQTWENNLHTVTMTSLSLADYDNDGWMDILLMGLVDSFRLYRNNRTSFIKNQTDILDGEDRFVAIYDGSVAFGDYDNDGWLDLIGNGHEEYTTLYVFNTSSGNYTDYVDDPEGQVLSLYFGSYIFWIDLDLDLDLDLIETGYGGGGGGWFQAKIYTNNISTKNTLPGPPTDFSNNFSNGQLTLSWGNASDNETPQAGLYYNLRVGLTSGGHEIVSGVFGGGDDNGYFGNMMQRKSITLNRPDLEGQTIYWAVQTIDTGLAKSEWSEEQIYVIGDACTENWSYSGWSGCMDGTQTRTAQDLNNCGTMDNRSALTQSCEEDDGSGSGGPSGSLADPDTATKRWVSIQAGREEAFAVVKPDISVTEIRVWVTERISNPSITISRLFKNPATGIPKGKVYQYLEINQTELEGKLANATLTFAVNSSWTEENNINYSAIYLNRFTNGSWERLETRLLDAKEFVYEATVSGFSYFSVSGEGNLPVICEEGERRCLENRLEECSTDGTVWNLVEDCPYGCLDSECIEVVCEEGQVKCDGNDIFLCSITEWVLGETCSFGCVDGKCQPFPIVYLVGIVGALLGIGGIAFVVRRRKGGSVSPSGEPQVANE